MSLHSVPVSSHGQINGFIADKTQTNQSRLAPWPHINNHPGIDKSLFRK